VGDVTQRVNHAGNRDPSVFEQQAALGLKKKAGSWAFPELGGLILSSMRQSELLQKAPADPANHGNGLAVADRLLVGCLDVR